MSNANPMNGALHFSSGSRSAGFAFKIGRAMKLRYFASGIFQYLLALDYICVFETHFATWLETKILRNGVFHEIVPVNIELATKSDLSRPCGGFLGIVHGIQLLDLSFRVIGNDHFNWAQNSQSTERTLVQIFPDRIFQN